MGLRDKIQENNRNVIIGASVLIVAAVALLIWRMQPPPAEELPRIRPQGFFYDLNTRQLLVDERSKAVPFETPSGPHKGEPAGVRAIVLACGDPANKANRFIGWLEKIERKGSDQQVMVRSPENPQWHSIASPEAERLMSAARRRCRGKPAVYVWPP